MSVPDFDFAHLTPAERLQLAVDLWNSIADLKAVAHSEALAAEFRGRLSRIEREGAGRSP